MSIRVMSQVWETTLPTTEKMVLLVIADHASDDGTNAWPSMATIARKVSISERQAQRCVQSLCTKGLVQCEVQAGGTKNTRSDRRPNLYTINVAALHGVTSTSSGEPTRGDIDDTHGTSPMSPEPSNTNTHMKKRDIPSPSVKVRGPRRGLAKTKPVEVVVIIGQDPDEAVSVPAKPTTKAKAPSNLPRLVDHFVRHPAIVMVRRYSPQDTMILRKSLKALLDAGVSPTTVIHMIDKFYATDRFRTAERPVLLFSKKDLQRELLSGVSTRSLRVEDPVLSYVQQEFIRTADMDLPWSASCDDDVRRMVMKHAFNACFRYPELVAEALSQISTLDNISDVTDTLVTLEEFLNKASDENNTETLTAYVQQLNNTLTLPKELLKPSYKTIRKDTATIEEAVFNHRRSSYAHR